jgi:hypothetical protein
MPMDVEQLLSILHEYPGSRMLKVIVDRREVQSMTVIEMLLKLTHETTYADIKSRPGDRYKVKLILTYFDRSDCIVRERREERPDQPPLEWVELDLR